MTNSPEPSKALKVLEVAYPKNPSFCNKWPELSFDIITLSYAQGVVLPQEGFFQIVLYFKYAGHELPTTILWGLDPGGQSQFDPSFHVHLYTAHFPACCDRPPAASPQPTRLEFTNSLGSEMGFN